MGMETGLLTNLYLLDTNGMNEILSQEYSNSQTFEEVERNYYLNVREFKSGEFEAVLKTVRPMQMEQLARRFKCPGAISASAQVEKARHFEMYGGPSESELAANQSRAVRRSKQNIRWLCKVMEADRLFTLTYRDNQLDREQTRADFTKFLRLVRSGWKGNVGVKDWKYVAVLEKQERGAYHIHCAVKGWQRINFLRKAWHKALGYKEEQFGENSPGNVNVTNPEKSRWGHTGREWKVNKLAGYLTKYLSKTFDSASAEKRRYWHCRDLIQPKKQRFWINATNMFDAIKSTVELLDFQVGLGNSFNHWLSTSNDSYWISGSGVTQ